MRARRACRLTSRPWNRLKTSKLKQQSAEAKARDMRERLEGFEAAHSEKAAVQLEKFLEEQTKKQKEAFLTAQNCATALTDAAKQNATAVRRLEKCGSTALGLFIPEHIASSIELRANYKTARDQLTGSITSFVNGAECFTRVANAEPQGEGAGSRVTLGPAELQEIGKMQAKSRADLMTLMKNNGKAAAPAPAPAPAAPAAASTAAASTAAPAAPAPAAQALRAAPSPAPDRVVKSRRNREAVQRRLSYHEVRMLYEVGGHPNMFPRKYHSRVRTLAWADIHKWVWPGEAERAKAADRPMPMLNKEFVTGCPEVQKMPDDTIAKRTGAGLRSVRGWRKSCARLPCSKAVEGGGEEVFEQELVDAGVIAEHGAESNDEYENRKRTHEDSDRQSEDATSSPAACPAASAPPPRYTLSPGRPECAQTAWSGCTLVAYGSW